MFPFFFLTQQYITEFQPCCCVELFIYYYYCMHFVVWLYYNCISLCLMNLGCFQFGLMWMMLLWAFSSVSSGEHVHSFLLCTFLRVRFLGHRIGRWATWVDIPRWFSKAAVPMYNPDSSSRCQRPLPSTCCPGLVLVVSFIWAFWWMGFQSTLFICLFQCVFWVSKGLMPHPSVQDLSFLGLSSFIYKLGTPS